MKKQIKSLDTKFCISLFVCICGFIYIPLETEASEIIVNTATVDKEELIYSNTIVSSISNNSVEIESKSDEIKLLNKELDISNLENLVFNQNSNPIYIYEENNESSKKLGILSKNSIGEINDFRIFNSEIDKFIAGEAEWFEIKSGDISGYIKNENLLIGNDAIEKLNNAYNAKVKIISNTNARVRIEPSIDSDIIDTLSPNSIVKLNKEKFIEGDSWIPIIIEGEEGFIRNDLIEIVNTVDYANKYIEPKKEIKKNNRTIVIPSEETPSAVVEYAMQFLGNPYVWGGTSLTNGADCSGFVMKVYEAFGVSLPHSSAADRNVGRAINYDEIQPGDIVCYDGHVGIYAGNGKIINALNKRSGIVLTNVNYDTILAIRRVL